MTIVIKKTGLEQFLTEKGESFLRVLILGHYGVGKTRSSSFWPRPLIIAFEPDNLASVADRNVPYVVPKTWGDIQDVVKRMEQEARKPVNQRVYQTIVVDTLDSAQDKILIPAIVEPQGKLAMSGYGDYGELGAKTMWIVNKLLALPMNVVVNVHIKQEDSDQEGVPTRFMPALIGESREKLPKDFQLVGWMRQKHVQNVKDGPWVIARSVHWEATRNFPILKDQFGRLPVDTPINFNENDYLQLIEEIFGDYLDTLAKTETVEEIESTAPAVVPPLQGGPVDPAAAKAAQSAAKKAAKPPAKKAATKTTSTPVAGPGSVPSAKKTAAPPPAASEGPKTAPGPASVPQTAPIETISSEVASEALGGDVSQDQQGVSEGPSSENERSQGSEDISPINAPGPTVSEPEAIKTVETVLNGKVIDQETGQEQAQTAPKHTPLPCGTPSKRIGAADPAPGCGRDLMGFDMNQVNIALLKTKTYLCPDCFKLWRTAQAAPAKV